MKLVTFERDGALRLGAITGDPQSAGARVVDLAAVAAAAGQPNAAFESAVALLAASAEGLQAARRALRSAAEQEAGPAGASQPLAGVRLRAPIPRPGKVLALAGNYGAHRAEGGVSTPQAQRALPEIFCKPVTSVIGPDESIRIPGPPVATVDYEGELGVVIGRLAEHVTEADALSYVGGYLCVNDVSGRKLDPGFERDPQTLDRARYFDWLIGKWCDTFCPIGPWLTTADEVPDPMALRLVTRVNGEPRQETSTGEMIHSIARTIAWCSALMTLEPGDIIATGTPAGVGSASGRFLRPGDVVEVEVSGLGTLRNPVAGR